MSTQTTHPAITRLAGLLANGLIRELGMEGAKEVADATIEAFALVEKLQVDLDNARATIRSVCSKERGGFPLTAEESERLEGAFAEAALARVRGEEKS